MRCTDNRLSRRNLLTVGAIGGLGLTLADFFQRQALGEAKKYDFLEAKAQSVIHIFLPGGIAHQETFDPKPYAPIEYRGEMNVAKTNTGEVFSETVPKLSLSYAPNGVTMYTLPTLIASRIPRSSYP